MATAKSSSRHSTDAAVFDIPSPHHTNFDIRNQFRGQGLDYHVPSTPMAATQNTGVADSVDGLPAGIYMGCPVAGDQEAPTIRRAAWENDDGGAGDVRVPLPPEVGCCLVS